MNPVDNSIGIKPQRGDLEQSRGSSASTRADRPGAVADDSASSAEATSESVSLTRTATDLFALETQLRELPGVDQARVERIREAISNGSFEIDTDRIVDNLLQTERELGA